METVKLSAIKIDGNTQSRQQLNESTVEEYTQAMLDGTEFPPVVLFHDGSSYWLADGFHRVMASRAANLENIAATIYPGTRRDAVLYSVGANASHGLPRTNADKRRAVTLLLQDEEWAAWSDREIARRCAVSNTFVAKVREDFSLSSVDSEKSAKTFTTKHGTEATMNTENIGKSKQLKLSREARYEQIISLASEGYRGEQIAREIGLSEKTIRRYSSEGGISLPDEAIKNTPRTDHARIIEQTVTGLSGYAIGLQSLDVHSAGIDKADALHWTLEIQENLKPINKLRKQLLEIANG